MTKSRALVGTLIGILIGIFFGNLLKVDLWWLLGIFLGLIVVLIIYWKKWQWRVTLLIIIGFCLGLGYFRFWDDHQRAIGLSYGKVIEFEGQIVSLGETVNNQSRYILKVNNSKIQITTGRFPEYFYGDRVKIKGLLKEPNNYLFYQGILGVFYNPEKIENIENQKIGIKTRAIKMVFKVRSKFEEGLNKTLSEPVASFAAGILLGSKRNIPDSLMSDFNRTGTTHIVAVSGYNVTIIIIYISLLFGIISRKFKFWGAILAILIFVIMTGASASVVRAGILAGLIAWGRFEGRRINMTIILLLCAVIMLLFNPYDLKNDISFQLSFLAFSGLVYFGPIISSLKIFQKIPKILRVTLSETLGAQILVLPILIFYFGQTSIISPLVNILILPLVPTAMGLVFLIGIGGLVWQPLGEFFGYLGYIVLKYIIVVVETFSKIPWASWQIKTSSWWWLVIFYAIISLVIYKFRKKAVYEPV